MRPSRFQLFLIANWGILAVLLAIVRHRFLPDDAGLLSLIWWGIGVCLIVLLTVDYFISASLGQIQASRHLPASLSLGTPISVTLRIQNPFDHRLYINLFDHFPQQVKVNGFPIKITIPAKEYSEISYHATPVRRGDAEFAKIELNVLSRLKFWDFKLNRGESVVVKIYPNFTNMGLRSMLHYEQKIGQMGIHTHQRRGQGIDFHQLREYRKGDTLSQVDWKATSRHVKLISREYQDERDQDIIFTLDCGRRMRTFDDEISHFDHALNALLLTAYIALKQGDAVGMLSFAGDNRWIPPIKGPAAINKLLNSVYDLHSTTHTTDLLQAANNLLTCHRKRALVVLISNIRQEDHDDLLTATKLLSKRHLVMVASLRETYLDKAVTEPVENFQSALRYCGAQHFIDQRKQVLESVTNKGVIITDSLPNKLHIDLANQYLLLKRSGRI